VELISHVCLLITTDLNWLNVLYHTGPGWLNELGSWINSISPIWCGFTPVFVNYKKGALDRQPQVIKLINYPSSVVLSGFFHHYNWSPWYSWNIPESDVKHNKSNQINIVSRERYFDCSSTFDFLISCLFVLNVILFYCASLLVINKFHLPIYLLLILQVLTHKCAVQKASVDVNISYYYTAIILIQSKTPI
jgi:hypothetical protein